MSRRTTGRQPQDALTTGGEGTRAVGRAESVAPPIERGRGGPTHGATAPRGWSPQPFRRHHQFWARIPQRRGPSPQRALGTPKPKEAELICEWLGELRRSARWTVLDAIARGPLRAIDAYTRLRNGDTPEAVGLVLGALRPPDAAGPLMVPLPPGADGPPGSPQNPDIEPLVDTAYVRWLKARNVGTWPEYVGKMRKLIPRGRPFFLREFTRLRIADWLEAGTGASFNRYRSTVSQFGEFLCEKTLLTENPVRAIKRRAERRPRKNYLKPEEVRQVLDAIPDPEVRAYHALLIATGVDAGALVPMRWRDVDDGASITVTVYGTKFDWRSGPRRLLHRDAGPIAAAWLRARRGRPQAFVFSFGCAPDTRAAIKRAVRAPGELLRPALAVLAPDAAAGRPDGGKAGTERATAQRPIWEDYTQKDHRHTFAVQALKDGYSFHVVSQQLGHQDTTLTHRIYGRLSERE
jgi:integrase